MRLAEIHQMCSAPSDAFSAGEWCEAANDLLSALGLAHEQLAGIRGWVTVYATGGCDEAEAMEEIDLLVNPARSPA